jgi:hypothetical protein
MQSSQRSPIIFLGASSSPLSLPNKAIPISLPQIGQTVILGLRPCFTKSNTFSHSL